MSDPKDYVLNIIDAVETLWLENEAAKVILDEYHIPEWESLIAKYSTQAENKAQARQRFATARALLQAALTDSKALASLSEALQQTNRTKKPN